jgi:hypothetical protein
LRREPFRYQIFCSDIAGQDIRAHYNDASHAIGAVRDWLRATRVGSRIPGSGRIRQRYIEFRLDLPAVARAPNPAVNELGFLDYRTLVTGWLDENSWWLCSVRRWLSRSFQKLGNVFLPDRSLAVAAQYAAFQSRDR